MNRIIQDLTLLESRCLSYCWFLFPQNELPLCYPQWMCFKLVKILQPVFLAFSLILLLAYFFQIDLRHLPRSYHFSCARLGIFLQYAEEPFGFQDFAKISHRLFPPLYQLLPLPNQSSEVIIYCVPFWPLHQDRFDLLPSPCTLFLRTSYLETHALTFSSLFQHSLHDV